MTLRRQRVATETDPKPHGPIPKEGFPVLLEEIYGINDLRSDDRGLAHEIRSLKMAEQDADKLKNGPSELRDAIANAKAAFLDRVYRAAIRNDLEFLDQLRRVVRYFERQDVTKNPSEAAIKKECALAAL